MKNLLILTALFAITISCKSQKVSDPCMKVDTNQIKQLIVGTWVDVKDTNHVMVVTADSVEESILIVEGSVKKWNNSYWNYKFTDNLFSSDDVTCYSLVEYKEGYKNKVNNAINGIDQNYMLLGGSGKMVFKRKN